MDITNDPRFFTDNVIDKRLAAFGGLAMVSGLMVQNAIDQSFGMVKDFDMTTIEGWCQMIGFAILTFVLFANAQATYVGVAQPYHTYRLMTAGPTGFEAAASYYLDPNIVAWRHASVKLMLLSLPWFLISSGFRLVVKFSRDATHEPDKDRWTLNDGRISGLIVWATYMIMGIVLAYVHFEHQHVFQTKYETMWHATGMGNMVAQVQDMMAPRSRGRETGPIDV